MGVFSIFKSAINGQYYYRLYSGNNKIVLNGEGYPYKQSCKDGVQSVKVNCIYDFRYEKSDKVDNYRFNLKAANGEIIGRSEGYTTAYARNQGIELIKSLAPTATIQDLA
ncbi:YegP family protein [Pedobacter sp. Leaf176]|uniref:YegP family protein n=1 Tax=unclassified Pedobacter TaxID=2628915 RepID=UPI0006F5D8BE|nr:YegP family protein [Pedobacter sp. Leaf176]KQR68397.1 hypothetical protein ASF92_16055 [Pedobacter sp. Leaf176]